MSNLQLSPSALFKGYLYMISDELEYLDTEANKFR